MALVTLAQIESSTDSYSNQRIIVGEIIRASKGSSMVIFPESSLSGRGVAIKENHLAIETTCRQQRMWAIYGGYEEDRGCLYNAAYVVSPEGLVYKYRKINIWREERDFGILPGKEAYNIIDTPLGRIGVVICWDLAFPELIRELVRRGARTIVCIANWSGDIQVAEALLIARSFENSCGLIFCNAAGRLFRVGSQVRVGSEKIVSLKGSLTGTIAFDGSSVNWYSDYLRKTFDCHP